MPTQDLTDLFTEALAVVNRALAANRDHPVFGRVLGLAEGHLDGHKANIVVYEDDPAAKEGFFTVKWEDHGLRLLTVGKGPHDTQWKVSRAYLQSLVDDPETYVDNPARLDLDWLAHRIPDGARQLFEWGTKAPE